VTILITRRNFAVWLTACAGAAALAAPAAARSWPSDNDSHVAYRRFRGEDEVRDDRDDDHGGGSGGGSSSGGGGSHSGDDSDTDKSDDKEKHAGSGGKKPSTAGGDDDVRFGSRK
jgi:hypothetical protein